MIDMLRVLSMPVLMLMVRDLDYHLARASGQTADIQDLRDACMKVLKEKQE